MLVGTPECATRQRLRGSATRTLALMAGLASDSNRLWGCASFINTADLLSLSSGFPFRSTGRRLFAAASPRESRRYVSPVTCARVAVPADGAISAELHGAGLDLDVAAYRDGDIERSDGVRGDVDTLQVGGRLHHLEAQDC